MTNSYVYVHLCAYVQLCAYTQPENKTDVKQRCKSIEEVALDACLRKFAQHHWFQTLFETGQSYFTRQCLFALLVADKAKIKGHLLNEIRFSETAPRNPIVVSPAFCLPAFCFLLLGDEAVSLRRRKRICILFLLSHMRPGTPVSVTGHRDSWDWQACKLMEIRLRRNQCNHCDQNQCDQRRDHCDQNANQLMLSFNLKEIGDRIFMSMHVVSSLGCIKSSNLILASQCQLERNLTVN